jgi:predicted acetyltransferase
MSEYPLSILKWMAIEHGRGTLGCVANVGEHGFGRDDAADSMEEGVAQGVFGATGDVWGAVDVVTNTPAMGVFCALTCEGVISIYERAMDMAWDDTAEAE